MIDAVKLIKRIDNAINAAIDEHDFDKATTLFKVKLMVCDMIKEDDHVEG